MYDINSHEPLVVKKLTSILVENAGGYVPSDILIKHGKVSEIGGYSVPSSTIQEIGYKVKLDTLDILYDKEKDTILISSKEKDTNNLDINNPVSRQVILAVGQANMILLMSLQSYGFQGRLSLSVEGNPLNDIITISQASTLIPTQ